MLFWKGGNTYEALHPETPNAHRQRQDKVPVVRYPVVGSELQPQKGWEHFHQSQKQAEKAFPENTPMGSLETKVDSSMSQRVGLPHLIGTWPPPGDRLHRIELTARWPKNMDYPFRDWAITHEDPYERPVGMFIRVWLYTYFRFFRA